MIATLLESYTSDIVQNMKICGSDYMANVNYMKQTECSKNDQKMDEKPTGEQEEKITPFPAMNERKI